MKPAIPVVPLIVGDQLCIQDFAAGSYQLRTVAFGTGAAALLRNNLLAYLWPLAFGGTHAAWIGHTSGQYGGGGGGGGGGPDSGSAGSYYISAIAVPTKVETALLQDAFYIEQIAAGPNRVVWTDYRHYSVTDTTIELYRYDLAVGAERRLTSHSGYKAAPCIGGDKVVWQDYRNKVADPENADIYIYDLSVNQEAAVCTDPSFQDQPCVYGSIVVWQDFRNAGADGRNADIYMRDMSGGAERPVCTAPGIQAYPKIHGTVIIWQDYRNASPSDTGNADIYCYDLATQREMPVVTKAGYQDEPYIGSAGAAWFDYTDGTLYKAVFDPSGVHMAVPEALTRQGTGCAVRLQGGTAVSGSWDLRGRHADGAQGFGVYLRPAGVSQPRP